MKTVNITKSFILLILFVVIGCNNNKKSEQKKESDLIVENETSIAKYAGEYSFGGDEDAPSGNVHIYHKENNIISFELFVCKGAPSYNMGELSGEVEIVNGKGLYKNSEYGECILEFIFSENSVSISQQEGGYDCGFGHNVYVNDTFVKESADANFSDYLITKNSVGEFKIGQQINIPYKSDIYKIERDKYEEYFEGENYITVAYRVFENEKEVLTIRPVYDYEGNVTNEILEIIILSEKFKTKEGIGVNSTIEDFMKQYPDYRIWWAYVGGDEYILDSENLGYNISFSINSSNFISEREINQDGITIVKYSDFKKGTKIEKIWMQNHE